MKIEPRDFDNAMNVRYKRKKREVRIRNLSKWMNVGVIF